MLSPGRHTPLSANKYPLTPFWIFLPPTLNILKESDEPLSNRKYPYLESFSATSKKALFFTSIMALPSEFVVAEPINWC